jgi:hypothetical protein
VQLHARARRFGGDRVGMGKQALDASDGDLEVLPRAAKICSLSSA